MTWSSRYVAGGGVAARPSSAARACALHAAGACGSGVGIGDPSESATTAVDDASGGSAFAGDAGTATDFETSHGFAQDD
jgi:hypothetical protein